jgi:Reverse transcriptase (RNA-dependent DNA polymerase)
VETSVHSSCSVDTAEDSDPICVLGSPIYKLSVQLFSNASTTKSSIVEACLDTGGGCNLIRQGALPSSTIVHPLKKAPNVAAAQGQKLSVHGVCHLHLQVGDQKTFEPVEFLVVDDLVVPLLLGTPWIDNHVVHIEPRTREVLLEFPGQSPSRVPLTQSHTSAALRVATPRCLPAFAETLVEVRTNRSGLSLLRPSRQRPGYVQVKNGIADLPVAGAKFFCWVGNFSDHPIYLRKGQIIGEAENQEATKICMVPNGVGLDSTDADWEDLVRSQSFHLSSEDQDRLLKSLRPHASLWDGHLGNISAVEHHIPTEGPPIASQPYRVGPAARELIDKELTRMKELKVVEPASGPWASPVVLIPKPDGSVRFCVDYRRLNSVTSKDSYALPRIDDSIDSLGGAQYFTTLDANSGYWQIVVSPEDQDKTTFTTHRGLYRFKRLPFGLVSAPATFQRAIDVILSSVRFQCALTYLD